MGKFPRSLSDIQRRNLIFQILITFLIISPNLSPLQVRKIVKKRHVPKHVLNAAKEHATIKESKKRKEANRRAHSKPGVVPHVAERDKHLIKEDE